MNGSNAVALQMPSSYVPMTSEEMTYLEGGTTVSQDMTLKDAKTLSYAMGGSGVIGVLLSYLVGGLGGVAGGLYFGKLVTDAYDAYEEACDYISQGYKKCTVKLTYIGGNLLVTGMRITSPKK